MEIIVRESIHRVKVEYQRRAREMNPQDGTIEIWVTEGEPQYGIEQRSGDQAPAPKIPNTPDGYLRVGWKEDPNEILKSLKDALAFGIPPNPEYEPNERGTSSPSNDGEGAPPNGYSWTPQVRKKITVAKVIYSMTYKFEKEEAD